MVAVKTRDVNYRFKELCNQIMGGESVIVSRPQNENVVIISEKHYSELEKAARNAAYLSMIDKSFEDAANGEIVTK